MRGILPERGGWACRHEHPDQGHGLTNPTREDPTSPLHETPSREVGSATTDGNERPWRIGSRIPTYRRSVPAWRYGIPLEWIYDGRMTNLHPHIRDARYAPPFQGRLSRRCGAPMLGERWSNSSYCRRPLDDRCCRSSGRRDSPDDIPTAAAGSRSGRTRSER